MKQFNRIMAVTLMIVFLFSAVSSLSLADLQQPVKTRQNTFLFPKSLVSVEEEAFVGTIPQTVVFHSGLKSIAPGAFASKTLTDAYIPLTADSIADSAFPLIPEFTIHGINGSYAQRWADKRQIAFSADYSTAFAPRAGKRILQAGLKEESFYQAVDPDEDKSVSGETEGREISMRPQDRPELYPIDERFP